MRKQPSVGEPARAAATIQPLDATTRQLAVLDAFAETGTYELTAAITGMPPGTVRNLLIEIREHYGAAATIGAYRAALAAGDLSTPGGRPLTVRS
jgi:DNA-directed RNA polymerase specialized sigma24 family protein